MTVANPMPHPKFPKLNLVGPTPPLVLSADVNLFKFRLYINGYGNWYAFTPCVAKESRFPERLHQDILSTLNEICSRPEFRFKTRCYCGTFNLFSPKCDLAGFPWKEKNGVRGWSILSSFGPEGSSNTFEETTFKGKLRLNPQANPLHPGLIGGKR